jgi:hypothetical protein
MTRRAGSRERPVAFFSYWVQKPRGAYATPLAGLEQIRLIDPDRERSHLVANVLHSVPNGSLVR